MAASSVQVKVLDLLEQFSDVEVVATEEIPPLEGATFSLDGVSKGSRFRVPLWVAFVLNEQGYVTIDKEEEMGWLSKVHWREKVQSPLDTVSLSELPSDFYARVRRTMEALRQARDDPVVQQNLKQTENLFSDVTKRRTQMIVEMALLDTVDLSLKEKLTYEEKWLLREIRSLLGVWTEKIGEF